jgi:hypothetical protein
MAVAIRHLGRRTEDLVNAVPDEAYDTLAQGVRHLRDRPASRPEIVTGFAPSLLDTMSKIRD